MGFGARSGASFAWLNGVRPAKRLQAVGLLHTQSRSAGVIAPLPALWTCPLSLSLVVACSGPRLAGCSPHLFALESCIEGRHLGLKHATWMAAPDQCHPPARTRSLALPMDSLTQDGTTRRREYDQTGLGASCLSCRRPTGVEQDRALWTLSLLRPSLVPPMSAHQAWWVAARMSSVDRIDRILDKEGGILSRMGMANLLAARAAVESTLAMSCSAAAGSDSDTSVPLSPRHLRAYTLGVNNRLSERRLPLDVRGADALLGARGGSAGASWGSRARSPREG